MVIRGTVATVKLIDPPDSTVIELKVFTVAPVAFVRVPVTSVKPDTVVVLPKVTVPEVTVKAPRVAVARVVAEEEVFCI